MSVTLEVSLPDLVIALSDYSNNSDFREALAVAKAKKSSTDSFLFLQKLTSSKWPRKPYSSLENLPQYGAKRSFPC